MPFHKTKISVFCCAALLSQNGFSADKATQKDENEIEKLVVTATVLGRSVLESATPVSILSGDQLEMNQAATLGETLKSVPGVNSTYFGPVSSSPIIRGLDGPRVKVVQNGMDSSDASRVGPDHITTNEAATATQIEVLRGPSTLLYGSGAIGGVVNVVDNRLPNVRQEGMTGRVSALHDTVSNERTLSSDLNGGQDNFAWHLDAFSRKTDNYAIPNFTLEDGDEVDELDNSFIDSHGFSLGAGWIGDEAALSFSYGKLDTDYGIPGHEHGHEEHDEHEEDHEDEEHDEHEDEPGVFARMQQDRFQSVLDLSNLTSWLTELHWHNAYTDYQHSEIEEGEIGTSFENDTFESRLWGKHAPINGWEGVLGLHFNASDFAAQGEEAFTPSTKSTNTALFLLEEKTIGEFIWQLGARLEHVKHKPDNVFFSDAQVNNNLSETSYTASSFSTGFVYDLGDNQSLAVNLAHSERAPSSAELYSNGIHISTATYEVGAAFALEIDDSDPDDIEFTVVQAEQEIKKESSNNVDITYRVQTEHLHANVSLFYNQIDNYLYQQNTGLFFHGHEEEGMEEAHHEEEEHHDEDHHEDAMPVYLFNQQDATLYGFEADLDWHLNDRLRISSFTDLTRAKLKGSGGENTNLPRIPPMRLGAKLHWEQDNWHAELGATHYFKQDKVADTETKTQGYTLLSAAFNYYTHFDATDITFYVKGNNLSDEVALVHSSFLKDDAPLPGRSFVMGVKVSF